MKGVIKMTDNKMNMNDELLENVTGGTEEVTDGKKTGPTITTRSNFCPRCRNARHHTVSKDGMTEVRVCDVCHLEYFYRVR